MIPMAPRLRLSVAPLFRSGIFLSRRYAVQTPGNPTLEVFDRKTKYLQKERAAHNVEESRNVDYLRDEVASRLSERLLVRTGTIQAMIADGQWLT